MMTQFGSAVAWLVLSPIALLTNIIGIVVVCHYKPQFHGTDVAFISLFVSMAMQALVVLPIPAALAIHDEGWLYSHLCSFYVGLVLCVRMSELLVMVVMNIHWMCILRFTSGQQVYSSATVVKIFVFLAWFGAVVTGIVPVAGPSFYTYYEETVTRKMVGMVGVEGVNATPLFSAISRADCEFLPHGLGMSFIVFFILVSLTTLILSLVASADTLTVFHYMRRTAVDKYKAGRFYLPSSMSTDPVQENHVPGAASSSGSGDEGVSDIHPQGLGRSTEHLTCLRSNGGMPGNHVSHPPTTSTESLPAGSVSSRSEEFDAVISIETGSFGRSETASYDPKVAASSSANLRNGARGAGKGGASSAAAVVVRPSAKSGVARSGPLTVHAKYNELNLSSELCRVVFCFTLLSALINHMPFVVLQFVQLVEDVDRQTAENTVLWLTLVQSLLLPHVLWGLSRRYRHALSYTWTVHVLRDDTAKEEDTAACMLQSYTRKVRTQDGGTVKVMARSRVRNPVTIATYQHDAVPPQGQANGNAVPVPDDDTVDSHEAAAPRAERVIGSGVATDDACADFSGRRGRQRSVTEVITTDLDDGMTVITNLASQRVTYIYDSPPTSLPDRKACTESSTNSGKSTPATSPSKSSMGTPSRESVAIQRTSSARMVWKEQMMKKHLPAIFINEAFELDEAGNDDIVRGEHEVGTLPDVTKVRNNNDVTNSVGSDSVGGGGGGGRGGSGKENNGDAQFHYYMSGNYHHNYLRSDSLPRIESESEGGSFQYDDGDIEGILDRRSSSTPSEQNSSHHQGTFLIDSREYNKPPHNLNQSVVLEKLQTSSNSSEFAGSDPDEYSVVFLPPRSSSLKSKPENSEVAETQSRNVNPVTRKPPRRSGVMVKQNSRPSLQHQKSIQGGPDHVEDETTTESVQRPVVERKVKASQRTFYPTFEAVSESPQAVPSTDLDADSQQNVDKTNVTNKKPSGKVDIADKNNVFLSQSQSVHVSNAADDAVDSSDVYVKIADVTCDATHTDDVGNSSTEAAVLKEAEKHTESFKPKEQATVLGILLEDGTEFSVNQELSIGGQEATEFGSVPYSNNDGNQSSGPFLANPDQAQSNIHTNPFFADIQCGNVQTQAPDVVLGKTSSSEKSNNYKNNVADVSTAASADVSSLSEAEKSTVIHDTGKRTPSLCNNNNDTSVMMAELGSDRSTQDSDNAQVLDVVETCSVDSEPSVVLEPYHADRRPPWMDMDDEGPPVVKRRSRNPFRPSFDADDSDALGSSGDFGSSFGSNAELGSIFENRNPASKYDLGNPFFHDAFTGKPLEDSDSDCLQSSGDSDRLREMGNGGSGFYQPYPIFDEETEKGFEDALALEHVIGANHYYGNIGRCFESIEEEPEDLSDSTGSPHKGDKEFSTTVISRPSPHSIDDSEFSETNPFGKAARNSSLPSQDSSSSVGINPFDAVPLPSPTTASKHEHFPEHSQTPEKESSVRSLDKRLLNGDLPAGDQNKVAISRISLTKAKPWPSIEDKPSVLGFESDFSSAKVNEEADKSNSFGQNSDEFEEDSGFSQINHVEDLQDMGTEVGPIVNNKPHVPVRPVRSGVTGDLRGGEADTNINPVYF